MSELTGLIKAMKETHLDTIKHLQHGFGYTEDRLKSADVDAYAFLRLIAALEKAIEQRNVQYRTKHIYEGVSWPILQPAIDRADMELVKILLRDAPPPQRELRGRRRMSKTNVKHGDIISRRKNFELKDGRRYWLTTNSGPSYDQGKWSNCLYLHFTKEDFPEITFPKLIPCDWGKQKQRFDYNSWSLADLPWHGGITYYEEMYHGEAQRTFVKAGCDFQHLWDDHFMLDDNGEMILDNDGEELRLAFEEFLSKLNQPTTPEGER